MPLWVSTVIIITKLMASELFVSQKMGDFIYVVKSLLYVSVTVLSV